MKGSVAKAEPGHCFDLVELMGEQELNHIRAGWNVDPLDGVIAALEASEEAFSIFCDGLVGGMFGCCPDGSVWLVSNPLMEGVRIQFVRQSREYISKMLERHEELGCYVANSNTPLLGWLKFSGFLFVPYGDAYQKAVLKRGDFKCVCRR